MIKRTKEEIEEKIRELWGDKVTININLYYKMDIESVSNVYIELSKMYDAPGLSFAQLKALSEFFDTEKIDDIDGFSQEGCETCDYGSKYGFTLRIG